MRGGPSHIDMWDPKPDAPVDYRGEFGTMDTNVPGIQLSDMMPGHAKVQDKYSIIRSLYHDNAGHSAGDQICFTGYPPGSDPNVNIHPSCGSIVAEQQQSLRPELPAYVAIPRQVPGTDSSYLGVAYRPFETQADPASSGPFEVKNFALPDGLSRSVWSKRMLSNFDRIASRGCLDRWKPWTVSSNKRGIW